jgi:hypothetical protein
MFEATGAGRWLAWRGGSAVESRVRGAGGIDMPVVAAMIRARVLGESRGESRDIIKPPCGFRVAAGLGASRA